MRELKPHSIIDYLKLTSPKITLLVVLTGLTGMLLASRGIGTPPTPSLFLWTLLGIGLASSGSSVLNNWYDRDIDKLMKRTSNRPFPLGRVEIMRSLYLGLILIVLAVFVLISFVNLKTAFLTILAVFVYSYLYTVILKRKTPYATEIGGISGALPPLIGWFAVKDSLSLEIIILFLIIFLWQPPHFWSLALKYRDDYEKAGIPALPVMSSKEKTILRSLVYVILLFIISLIPFFIGMAGKLYLATSIILGIIYVSLYVASLFIERDQNRLHFIYSIVYLPVVFLSLAIGM